MKLHILSDLHLEVSRLASGEQGVYSGFGGWYLMQKHNKRVLVRRNKRETTVSHMLHLVIQSERTMRS
ncbi:MAG: hypothetical protein ABIG35_01235 [Pseudomonadota bacterium]